MVDGFMLNNQLTDFAFAPGPPDGGRRQPRRAGQTAALLDGADHRAQGRQAGLRAGLAGRQQHHLLSSPTTLIALIDWKMDMQAAVSLPHLVNRFGRYDLEAGHRRRRRLPTTDALGYEVEVKELNSGLHGIAISPDGLTGGTDPRREGVAVGD